MEYLLDGWPKKEDAARAMKIISKALVEADMLYGDDVIGRRTVAMSGNEHELRRSMGWDCQGQQFTHAELDILRQWFNAVEDLNNKYLTSEDRALYDKIMGALRGSKE